MILKYSQRSMNFATAARMLVHWTLIAVFNFGVIYLERSIFVFETKHQ